MALQVTVNIKSNKIEAKRDSFNYKVDLNESNLWKSSFDAIVLQNSNYRYSNIDSNELVLVKRLSDGEHIFVEYKLLSNFITVKSGEDADIGDLGDRVNILEQNEVNIINALEGKVGEGDLSEVAISGNYDDLSNTPPTLQFEGGVEEENNVVKLSDLGEGNFLVGGANSNEGRKIKPSDLSLNDGYILSAQGSQFSNMQSNVSPGSGTLVTRTSTGQGKFAEAIDADEAVVLSQYQAGLEGKIDKVAGKVLSDSNFTLDEKQKLAGLEDVHYKGWFSSLVALEAKYPTAEEGSHAFVDDANGSILYIWDVGTTSWDARVGESTEVTASQVKVLYESNPDTNAFTDDLKSKLESMTSAFTSILKTTYDNVVVWINANKDALLNHLSAKNNPHEVTASQVGLGKVDNTSDANKPISTATQTALDNKVNFPSSNGHIPARDSSGSQTSLPYTTDHLTGETCVVLRGTGGRINAVDPISDQHVATKKYADRVWTPDYSNMETTNRITSTGGTWTSNRTGFVYILSRGYNVGIYNTEVVTINGKEVGRVWVEANSGSGNARSGSFSNIYPIKVGDTILVRGNLEVKCLFIPGIWV